VAYHGTSGFLENDIEREGIRWKGERYSRQEVDAVLKIFEQLHWRGSGAGFQVLNSFTKKDYARSLQPDRKPIFLAETSFRAVLYASADYAGGETARALRYSFDDLDHYLRDVDFRKQSIHDSWLSLRKMQPYSVPPDCEPEQGGPATFTHLQKLWRYYGSQGIWRGPIFQLGLEPHFSPAWLREQLLKLDLLRQRCFRAASEHKHGVIFAVRLKESDISQLTYDSDGIIFDGSLPPERILGKVRVAPDVGNPDEIGSARTGQLLALWGASEGWHAAMKKRTTNQ
jgi:hypothetical protein